MTPTPEYRIIELTQGQVAVVDVEDFDWLNAYLWCVTRSTHHLYAVTHIKVNGRWSSVLMHRMILGLEKGIVLVRQMS